jgi:hypothetical protein
MATVTARTARSARFLVPAVDALALSACVAACGLTADFSNLQSGYCASPPATRVFCADFDQKPLPFPWGSINQLGGQIRLDSTVSVSPPNSAFEQDLQMGQTGAAVIDSTLRVFFPQILPPPSTLDFEFWIQPGSVSAAPDGTRLVAAALDLLGAPQGADGGADGAPDGAADGGADGATDAAADGRADGGTDASTDGGSDAGSDGGAGAAPMPNRYSLQFTLVLNTNTTLNSDTLSLALEEVSTAPGACPSYNSHAIMGPIATSWTDVHLTVRLGAGTTAGAPPVAEAVVWFGATQVLETPLCMNFAPTQAGIGIGSIYKSVPTSIWSNYYDNVTLDMTPGP